MLVCDDGRSCFITTENAHHAVQRKQFDKGIKTADSILKSHPKHGETLSMKGLLCNQLGRKVRV